MVRQSVRELSRKLEETEASLAIVEDKLRDRDAIMDELLTALGSRTTCAKCGKAVYWLHVRGGGPAKMYNPDGTEHWPRCVRLAAAKEIA